MAQMAENFLLSRLARLGCVVLLGFAAYLMLVPAPLSAAVMLAAALLIWTTPAGRPRHSMPVWKRTNQLFMVLVTGLVLLGMFSGSQGLQNWLFVLPLTAFALLPAPSAILVTLAVLLGGLAITALPQAGSERHQLAGALLLSVMLSAIVVFLRAFKSRQLVPLRRTDELTQAASREYLSADLHKEIQRSEREGIDMAVAMIGLDTHLSKADLDADIRAILPRIGRFLNAQLRDFDSYYRVADLQFLIILPGNRTADASEKAEQIRRGLHSLFDSHDLALTASAGVAGLNIGDDAASLQQSAANALRRAQQQGGNRVQAYSVWSAQSRPSAAGFEPLPREVTSHD